MDALLDKRGRHIGPMGLPVSWFVNVAGLPARPEPVLSEAKERASIIALLAAIG